MSSVVLDTDIVSFLFKKDTRGRRYRRHLHQKNLLISFMTLAELHAWGTRRGWGQLLVDRMTQHLHLYTVCHSDSLLCERWADVDAHARRLGRPIQCADAWVAATALYLVALAINNVRNWRS